MTLAEEMASVAGAPLALTALLVGSIHGDVSRGFAGGVIVLVGRDEVAEAKLAILGMELIAAGSAVLDTVATIIALSMK